jgi:hypothetical protein
MDHGANNPTCWLLWAVDYDGNLVVADEYYSPGLVSRHAPEILRRRGQWWQTNGRVNSCWADPSVFARHGLETRLGDPASIATEYADFRIGLSPANNDRAAGYLRLCELLHIEPGRIPPPWANAPADIGGAPRLYVFSSCTHLIQQLKSAPVAADGVDDGEAVDPKWATNHGHAVDAARYGALSRPPPSEEPPPPLTGRTGRSTPPDLRARAGAVGGDGVRTVRGRPVRRVAVTTPGGWKRVPARGVTGRGIRTETRRAARPRVSRSRPSP